MAKLKFVEVPVMIRLKDGENSVERKETLFVCTEPPIEIIAHPVLVGRSVLTTKLGIKEVSLPAAEVVKVLGG